MIASQDDALPIVTPDLAWRLDAAETAARRPLTGTASTARPPRDRRRSIMVYQFGPPPPVNPFEPPRGRDTERHNRPPEAAPPVPGGPDAAGRRPAIVPLGASRASLAPGGR
jgi:hypothetical protein